MRIDYLNIPGLEDKRHVIVDGRYTVNTAAKPSNVIYLMDRGRNEDEKSKPTKRACIREQNQ